MESSQANESDSTGSSVLETENRLIGLLVPLGAGLGILTFLAVFSGWPLVFKVSRLALIFLVAGKLLIFVGLHPRATLSIVEIGILVSFMEISIAVFLSYYLDLLYKLPWLGGKIRKCREQCQVLLVAQPWMRKYAITGVILFVTCPVSGTGVFPGTMLGQILGLRRKTIITAAVIGSLIGTMTLVLGASLLGAILEEWIRNPMVQGTVFLSLLAFAMVTSFYFQRALKKCSVTSSKEEGACRPVSSDL